MYIKPRVNAVQITSEIEAAFPSLQTTLIDERHKVRGSIEKLQCRLCADIGWLVRSIQVVSIV